MVQTIDKTCLRIYQPWKSGSPSNVVKAASDEGHIFNLITIYQEEFLTKKCRVLLLCCYHINLSYTE